MTVGVYYHIFGFLVKKDDYLRHFGYVLKNLPEFYKAEVEGEVEGEDENGFFEDALDEWIRDEHGNGFCFYKNITVNSVNHGSCTYTLRGFTHDDKFSEYLVIGIDLGSIDRWDGTRRDGTGDYIYNPQKWIRDLAKSPEWISLIQACGSKNCTRYDQIEYGIQHPIYEKSSISPAVYLTTDDCDCCS
jgi:hypothetical protein